MRELQGRWKQVALAPRTQGEAMWRRFKTAQDAVFARTSAHLAAQNEERAANLARKQALCEQAEALSDSSDWVKTATAHPGAAGRVEDDRAGVARQREGDLGALPRRVRSVLHPPARRPEEAQGRVVREPGAQGSAVRPGRGAGRLDRLGSRRRRSARSCRPSGSRSGRCAGRNPRPCGSASAPRATRSSIATSTATRWSCSRRPRRAPT